MPPESGFDPICLPPDVGGGGGCCCCLPPPAPDQSNAPAGTGLTVGGESGFGANAITTAGGYTIVPTGDNQGWDIYEPGQKPGDKPSTHIWGDPHVNESDGTNWDFTKNSVFRLPDGTAIAVNTTPYNGDQGHRVTSSLDITNGADHVQVTGIDNNQPKVGEVTHDGYKARAETANEDTFTLGGDSSNIKWFKSTGQGENLGEVTGASFVTQADGTTGYQQDIKAGDYVCDPSLQPKPGTAAWGNMLRDNVVDIAKQKYGAGSVGAELTAAGADANHKAHTPEADQQRKQLEQLLDGLKALINLLSFLRMGLPGASTGTGGNTGTGNTGTTGGNKPPTWNPIGDGPVFKVHADLPIGTRPPVNRPPIGQPINKVRADLPHPGPVLRPPIGGGQVNKIVADRPELPIFRPGGEINKIAADRPDVQIDDPGFNPGGDPGNDIDPGFNIDPGINDRIEDPGFSPQTDVQLDDIERGGIDLPEGGFNDFEEA